jgi:hypothetical protein
MLKRSSNDINETAFAIVQQATGQTTAKPPPVPPSPATKNPAAVALGRLGGLRGGKARAESLTPERKREIARFAAQTRWKKLANKSNHPDL